MRTLCVVGSVVGISLVCFAQQQSKTGDEYSRSDRMSQRVARGYASKSETAIEIARAVIKDVGWYNRDCEPLKAKKYDGFWLVFGSGPKSGEVGGRLEVEIDIHSGAVLRLFGSN